LTTKEEREWSRLEKEDFKNIEGVYNTLIKDKGIQEQMERIKEHEWVRVVENEENDNS